MPYFCLINLLWYPLFYIYFAEVATTSYNKRFINKLLIVEIECLSLGFASLVEYVCSKSINVIRLRLLICLLLSLTGKDISKTAKGWGFRS